MFTHRILKILYINISKWNEDIARRRFVHMMCVFTLTRYWWFVQLDSLKFRKKLIYNLLICENATSSTYYLIFINKKLQQSEKRFFDSLDNMPRVTVTKSSTFYGSLTQLFLLLLLCLFGTSIADNIPEKNTNPDDEVTLHFC